MPDIVRIGGQQYSWNSTATRIDGQPWRGITSVDWAQKLDVETVYSQTQDGVPIGPTAGQYAVESLSIKMLWEYAEQLKLYLATAAPGVPPGNRGAPGTYGQTTFILQCSASEPLQVAALPIMVDAGPCRIIGEKETHAKGSAALELELTLWCRQLRINGLTMYSSALPAMM